MSCQEYGLPSIGVCHENVRNNPECPSMLSTVRVLLWYVDSVQFTSGRSRAMVRPVQLMTLCNNSLLNHVVFGGCKESHSIRCSVSLPSTLLQKPVFVFHLCWVIQLPSTRSKGSNKCKIMVNFFMHSPSQFFHTLRLRGDNLTQNHPLEGCLRTEFSFKCENAHFCRRTPPWKSSWDMTLDNLAAYGISRSSHSTN